MTEIRLNKLLADCGIASRRAADRMIENGKVMVDAELVTELGTKVDPDLQRVEVDGIVLRSAQVRKRYYLLHKPVGVVCTNDERELRKRAADLITDRDKGRIYTVGRLDERTSGLILLTNDGEFAHKVMHPRYGIPRTYAVKLSGRIDDGALGRVRDGVHLAEGRTMGARVVVQRRTERTSRLLVTVYEGKNREIRRIFARVGFKVKDLARVRIGNLSDRGLKNGQWRPLTRAEVADLLDLSAASPDEIQGLLVGRRTEREWSSRRRGMIQDRREGYLKRGKSGGRGRSGSGSKSYPSPGGGNTGRAGSSRPRRSRPSQAGHS